MENNYLVSPIISAIEVKRDMLGCGEFIGKTIKHWGILVKNSQGEYLVHNGLSTGVVAVHKQHMSSNWKNHKILTVKGSKTISGMFQNADIVPFVKVCELQQGTLKYLLQDTCIGSTEYMKSYLRK